jgi:hypothetical protein
MVFGGTCAVFPCGAARGENVSFRTSTKDIDLYGLSGALFVTGNRFSTCR